MSYTKRADVACRDGETVVELDTGALVAVACVRKRVSAGLCYHATARAIDEDALPVLDPQGRAIATEFKLSLPIDKVEEHADPAITREMLFAVLGEPVAVFPWSENTLAEVNIRVSLAAAAYSGQADAGAAL